MNNLYLFNVERSSLLTLLLSHELTYQHEFGIIFFSELQIGENMTKAHLDLFSFNLIFGITKAYSSLLTNKVNICSNL